MITPLFLFSASKKAASIRIIENKKDSIICEISEKEFLDSTGELIADHVYQGAEFNMHGDYAEGFKAGLSRGLKVNENIIKNEEEFKKTFHSEITYDHI